MDLIPVMLVDDDRLVLENLHNLIDWHFLGYKVVATAMNGKRALSLFQKYNPKVVITDIAMPIMNGLELSEAIHKQNSSVQLLIVTAYDEFNYAKKAIQSGVTDYILKTEISSASLENKLVEIHKKLSKGMHQQQRTLQLELQDYFMCSQDGNTESLKPLSFLSNNFEKISRFKYIFFVVSEVRPWIRRQYQQSSDNINELGGYLYDKISLMDMASFNSPIVFQNEDKVIIGTQISSDKDVQKSYLHSIGRKINYCLHNSSDSRQYVVFYYPTPVTIRSFKKHYCDNKQFITLNSLLPSQQVVDITSFDNQQAITTSKRFSYHYLKNIIEHEDQVKLVFQEHLSMLIENSDLAGLTQFYNDICIFFEDISDNQFKIESSVLLPNKEVFINWLMSNYNKSAQFSNKSNMKPCSLAVQQAMAYIKKHFGEFDLSLERVAEHVALSSGRLGVLFKNEIGSTINDYITHTRIKEAVFLLENSNYKIYEITEKVGYKSSQYFSQIFYQVTNKRPSNLRKLPVQQCLHKKQI